MICKLLAKTTLNYHRNIYIYIYIYIYIHTFVRMKALSSIKKFNKEMISNYFSVRISKATINIRMAIKYKADTISK
jgi:hypothetical protein